MHSVTIPYQARVQAPGRTHTEQNTGPWPPGDVHAGLTEMVSIQIPLPSEGFAAVIAMRSGTDRQSSLREQLAGDLQLAHGGPAQVGVL